ncbi:cytochrome C assembly family protein [Aliidiomarina celeris]|uniref:cytochrome C assembly family protein n=1 Tax=Aliidiomarina celeris TaxID=2249428 RepID=UPI0013001D00|nr:cytochrome c biogenesis protein CcsA [Aliidiomarina celeris]
MLVQSLTALCILLYIAAILFLNRRLSAPNTYTKRVWLSNIAAIVGHGVLIALYLSQHGFEQLNFLSALTIIAWLLGLFSVSRGSQLASLMLRPAIFGFATVSIALLQVLPSSQPVSGNMTVELAIHIVLSLLAFSLLTLAALYAGQILYLNRVLKQRTARVLDEHLPPLMAVEQYFFRLLSAGTLLLTLALIAGMLFVDGMFAKEQLHKTILSFTAWFCFGLITLLHYTRGLRGRPMVLLTLVASVLLTLGYFGSRIVRDILLS